MRNYYNLKFKILPHTADLKIQAYGETKKEVFLNMLLAMTSALRAKVKSQKSKIKNIKIKSPDLDSLLVDFLSEVLYLIQVDRVLYDKVKFRNLTDAELEGELIGQKVERFGEEIKAVTWHSLDIHQKEDGTWQATVLFDV